MVVQSACGRDGNLRSNHEKNQSKLMLHANSLCGNALNARKPWLAHFRAGRGPRTVWRGPITTDSIFPAGRMVVNGNFPGAAEGRRPGGGTL